MTGPSDTQADPGEADDEAGTVVLEGLAGVAVVMTPNAARRTGERLVDAAARAEQGGEASESGDLRNTEREG